MRCVSVERGLNMERKSVESQNIQNRSVLRDMDGNRYATFPRRKRYSWYKPADTMVDRRIKTERRRTQLLDQYSETDEGNISIGEWMALLKERDQLLKESLKRENEEAKLKFLGELNHLLLDVPDFSPEDDVNIAESVLSLKQNIRTYCSHHKITPSIPNKKMTNKENSAVTPTPVQKPSPSKPPVPKNKPKLLRTTTTPPKLSHEAVRVSTESGRQRPSIATVRPLPIPESDKESGEIESLLQPQFRDGCSTSNDGGSDLKAHVNSGVPLVPAGVPPPPPPPISLPFNNDESLPNSNCSSMSLQDEIVSHKKTGLRHVTGPKTPGGTPMRSLDNTDLLQQALMRKFRAIHIHSTPKRNGLMDSNSIEVSNAWSEWGASIDNPHQYASDPDFSRDMTTPLPQSSSAHSAADFESTFSSPSQFDS